MALANFPGVYFFWQFLMEYSVRWGPCSLGEKMGRQEE